MLVCRRLADYEMTLNGNLPYHCRKPNDGSAKMDAMVIATWAVFAAWGWGGGQKQN